MNDLVFKGQNDQVITTSLKVAEKFKKEHRNVLKSIRKLMTAKNVAVAKMFDEQMYVNDQGKEQPMFYMNRDGFTLLASWFLYQTEGMSKIIMTIPKKMIGNN